MNSYRNLAKSLHVVALLGALPALAQTTDASKPADPAANTAPALSAPASDKIAVKQVEAPKSYTRRVEPVKSTPSGFEVLGDVSVEPTPEQLQNLYPQNAEGLSEVKEMEKRFNGPDGFLQRFLETRNYPAQNFFTTRWGSVPAFETILPSAEKADGLPETEKIDIIEFENADLNGVLRELARKMDISYITPNDIPETRVTVQFKGMSPTDAFRALVKNNKKEVFKVFGAYTLRDPLPPSMLLRRYKLSFNYEDKSVATSSGSSLSSGAGSSTGITFGEQPQAGKAGAGGNSGSPTVVYQETERILTINAMQQGQDAVMTYLETINRPQENIEMEVFVAETSVNPKSFTGVDWSFAGENGYTVGGAGAFTKLVDGFAEVNNGTAAAVALGKISIPNISATIRMLETDTNSKTYAHPSLLTTNNRPAILESVVEVPYQLSSTTSSTGSTTDSVNNNSTAFKRVGVTVGIRPILQDHGIIRIKVNVSISSVAGTAQDGQPIISTRSYGGDFSVMNGEYIVIGGLGQSSFTTTNNAVPYLSAMPILGNLFKNNNTSNDTKNMLIFVRPSVKDSFYKGVKPNYVDKRASFAKFEEGKINHNTQQVIRHERDIKDPFIKSRLQKNIVEVDKRIETLGLTRAALEEEKKKATEAEAAKVKALQTEVDELGKELSNNWDNPEKLRESAEKKVEVQQKLEEAVSTQKKVEAGFDEAIAPLEKKIEDAKVEREATAEELKRLEELDKLYMPKFDEDGKLKVQVGPGTPTATVGEKVDDITTSNTVVGSSALNKEGVTSLSTKAEQPKPVVKTEAATVVPAPEVAPTVAPVPVIPVIIPEPVVIAPVPVPAPKPVVAPAQEAPIVVAPVIPKTDVKPSVNPVPEAPATAVVPTVKAPVVTAPAPKPVVVPKPAVVAPAPAKAPVAAPKEEKKEPVTETLDLDALFKDLEGGK
jgi:Flp pilus assembly secretin CpaC